MEIPVGLQSHPELCRGLQQPATDPIRAQLGGRTEAARAGEIGAAISGRGERPDFERALGGLTRLDFSWRSDGHCALSGRHVGGMGTCVPKRLGIMRVSDAEGRSENERLGTVSKLDSTTRFFSGA